jgi:GTP-binding protein EngB required for normal cell division
MYLKMRMLSMIKLLENSLSVTNWWKHHRNHSRIIHSIRSYFRQQLRDSCTTLQGDSCCSNSQSMSTNLMNYKTMNRYNNMQRQTSCNRVSEYVSFQYRCMAFVTGHARTKKKNKKKRAAKAMDHQKNNKKTRMTDEEYKEYQKKLKLQQRENKSKQNAKSNQSSKLKSRFDPSTTPNYPLGPNGLTDVIDNEDGTMTIVPPESRTSSATSSNPTTDSDKDNDTESATESKQGAVPPAILLPTGSLHVFVAKIVCQQVKMNPRETLFASADEYIRHDPRIRTSYTFEPYGPMFASSQSTIHNNTNNHNHHHNLMDSDKPEVAFLGRSNVGKSSLINALMNRTLAVTSKQPGRTQQAYYYGWIPSHIVSSFIPNSNSRMNHVHTSSTSTTSSHITSIPISAVTGFLVDLPGYGYAVGPNSAIDTWQIATQDYLCQRRDMGTLKRVYVLQDARLQSPQPIDGDVLHWLEEAEIPHTVVLTKADDHNVPDDKNGGTSKAGVIKHANICCFRYYHLWSESGATLPDDDVDNNDSSRPLQDHDGIDDDDNDTNNHDNDIGDHGEVDDDDRSGEGTNDEEEGEEVDDEENVTGPIMLSPMVHVTSAKKQTGLAELLASIETEFTPDLME